MTKLVILLCGTIFLTMLIGGQDRGQLRFGLMAEPEVRQQEPVKRAAITSQPAPQTAVTPAVTSAVFAPSEPVMVTPAETVTPAESVRMVELLPPAPEIVPKVLYVDAKSVNVREGPGKGFPVLARLSRGEAVQAMDELDGPAGWTRIRIEGDGLEGYIASNLLAE